MLVRAVQQCFLHPVLRVSGVALRRQLRTRPFHGTMLQIARNGGTTISNSETLLVSVYAAPARELSSCAIGRRLSRKRISARSDSGLTRSVSCVSTSVGVRGAVSVMVAGSVRCVGCKHPGSFEVSWCWIKASHVFAFCPSLIIAFSHRLCTPCPFSHLSVMDLKLIILSS